MSQFAELFKAVKNEPKNSSDNKENKNTASSKNTKPVKDKNAKNADNKPKDGRKSAARNLKIQMPAAKKAVNSDAVQEAPQQENESKADDSKKIGKSRNDDYTQVLTYIRRDTHREIKKVLIDDFAKRDLSDLVEELLSDWLKKNL